MPANSCQSSVNRQSHLVANDLMNNKSKSGLSSTDPALTKRETAATMTPTQADTNPIQGLLALVTKASKSGRISKHPTAANMKPQQKKRGKRYNGFKIFFMLERQLLLHAHGSGTNIIEKPIDGSHLPLVKNKELSLPPLHLCDHILTVTSTCVLSTVNASVHYSQRTL